MMHRNMTAAEVLACARRDGLLLVVADDGGLLVRGDVAARDRWLDALRQHKADLLLLLWTETLREHFEERAAIFEFDGGLPRAEAETAARASTALLARAAGAPWRALREALNDPALPDKVAAVDALPYGPPRWTTTPSGVVVAQGVHMAPSSRLSGGDIEKKRVPVVNRPRTLEGPTVNQSPPG